MGAELRGAITMPILKPPAHPELDVVDDARAIRWVFKSDAARATCAGVVKLVVFGSP